MSAKLTIENAEIMAELEQNCPDIVLPTGYVTQRTAAAIVQSKDNATMSATFAIVTRTAQPNRYGNQLQLLPNANGAGPVTDYYQQNPVVLYDHNLSGLTLPIGLSKPKDGPVALAWSATQGIATCYFADQPWAEPIFAAVDDGLLKMASIGFDPILAMRLRQAGPQQATGQDGVQDLTWLGMDFTQWEMLEWSIVPIGADRGALRQCLDRGNIHGVKLPQFLKQSFSQHAAEAKKLGIGMNFKKLEFQRISIEGPEDEVDSAIETLQAKKPMTCAACGSAMQCAQCMKQAEEPEPDIAPDVSMSYPTPQQVAQSCSAMITQSDLARIQQGVLSGITQAVKLAVKPVAQSVDKISAEFRRMTGKLDD